MYLLSVVSSLFFHPSRKMYERLLCCSVFLLQKRSFSVSAFWGEKRAISTLLPIPHICCFYAFKSISPKDREQKENLSIKTSWIFLSLWSGPQKRRKLAKIRDSGSVALTKLFSLPGRKKAFFRLWFGFHRSLWSSRHFPKNPIKSLWALLRRDLRHLNRPYCSSKSVFRPNCTQKEWGNINLECNRSTLGKTGLDYCRRPVAFKVG